ncbi:MAG: DUF1697 domain-containing protein [Thermoleophilia bacterium]
MQEGSLLLDSISYREGAKKGAAKLKTSLRLSHINSGNVIFLTDMAGRAKIGKLIEKSLAKAFGYKTRVLIRLDCPPELLSSLLAVQPFFFPAPRDINCSGKSISRQLIEAAKSLDSPETASIAPPPWPLWPCQNPPLFCIITKEANYT